MATQLLRDAPPRQHVAEVGQSAMHSLALLTAALPTLSRYAPAHAPFPQRCRGPHVTAFDRLNSCDQLGRAGHRAALAGGYLTLIAALTLTLTLTRPGTVRLWLEAGPVVSTEDMPLQGAACCCVL